MCLVLFSMYLYPCACALATECMSGFQSHVTEALWCGCDVSQKAVLVCLFMCAYIRARERVLVNMCMCVSVRVCVGFHACVYV